MSTLEKIIGILRELSPCRGLGAGSALQEDAGLDSLGMVALLVAVEDCFSIQLEESDMDPFLLQTVGDIVCLTDKYLERREAHTDSE